MNRTACTALVKSVTWFWIESSSSLFGQRSMEPPRNASIIQDVSRRDSINYLLFKCFFETSAYYSWTLSRSHMCPLVSVSLIVNNVFVASVANILFGQCVCVSHVLVQRAWKDRPCTRPLQRVEHVLWCVELMPMTLYYSKTPSIRPDSL